jgi:ferredoxin-NADP reductase/MOSC domain-containing protein YiiM
MTTASKVKGTLVSLNVSGVKEVPYQGRTVKTGIFKEPVKGRAMVRRLNIAGDDQADRRVHGGFDMAVYAYPEQHYAFWKKELDRDDFVHGQFGENLTVRGLNEDSVRVGDLFRIGGALFQVTQPRIPCYKLVIRMNEGSDFAGRFQRTGRMGFYFRVLEEGEIGSGDSIECVETDENSVTIAEFISTYLHDSHDPEKVRRVLVSRDLGEAWRVYLENILKKIEPVEMPDGWQGFRTFLVDREVTESSAVTSFYLKPKDGRPLSSFRPGQYLTFRLSIPDHPKPVTRTYSLSSSSNNSDFYRISVKRLGPPADKPEVPAGLGSGYLHHHVQVGSELCVKAPRGKFILDPNEETPIVLLSGGIGLTPLVSMLAAVVEADSPRPVWFIHGVRNGREHALREEVRRLASGRDKINFHFAYSQPTAEDVLGRDYDTQGRVTTELVRGLLPPAAYDFYLCGPTTFMESLYPGLLEWGVPQSRIHYEFFGPAADLTGSRQTGETSRAEGEWNVTFTRSGMSVSWSSEHSSILELAEAQGLRPDFSCRSGICHTCMVPLARGEVVYECDPIDDPDPGQVLICCAKPKSDVVIEV